MKKANRIIAAILSSLLLCSCVSVFAQKNEKETSPVQAEAKETADDIADDTDNGFNIPEKVEIIFSVGDDTLLINGESVKVETAPYVVGEGTTLVPVRVITEAFGAKVGWDGETRTVTLKYPDVNIVLQIGNPIAEVNGEAVTLLAAPELPDGRTMVPLRFISENFGADVGYDEATRGISVTKETVPEGDTVEGVIDTKYIGDSFYGWTMDNPKDLVMSDREFDGSSTEFSDEANENTISVDISKKKDDYDFDKQFKAGKELYSSIATLIKAETNTDDEKCRIIHIEARTGKAYIYEKIFVTEKYIYHLGVFTDNNDEIKKQFISLAESFRLVFEETDTHDLSNLENGMRRFESEEMNFSLLLPANLTGGETLLKVNEFAFTANDGGRTSVSIEIVSKSEAEKTPVGYVEFDMDNSTRGINKDISRYSGISEKKYGDITAYEYDLIIEGSKSSDCTVRFLSFELGEYIYKLNIIIDADSESPPENIISSILDNMSFKEIDTEKAGIIMDSIDMDELSEECELKVGTMKIKAPSYYETYNSDGTAIYDESRAILVTSASQVSPSNISLKTFVDSFRLSLKNDADSDEELDRTFTEVKTVSINYRKYYKFSATTVLDQSAICEDMYFCEINGMMYMFVFSYPELYNSKETTAEFEEMLKTLGK